MLSLKMEMYNLLYTVVVISPFVIVYYWFVRRSEYYYPRKGDLVLFNNPPTYTKYVSRKRWFGVVQLWVIPVKEVKTPLNKEQVQEYLEIVKYRNKAGVNSTSGDFVFPGKVSFFLSSPFTKEKYKRYEKLMGKVGFEWQGDNLPPMKPMQWDKARLTIEYYSDLKNLTNSEADELYDLLRLKYDFGKKRGVKKIMSPYDAIVKVVYEANYYKTKSRDYLFENELENLSESLDDLSADKENLLGKSGIFVGGGCYYSEQGNFLTVGGTRSGKGTNLIIPQLLSTDQFSGSTVVIDVKGENAAISAKHLKDAGKQVYILDPWDLQSKIGADHGIASSKFNPLDILRDAGDDTPDECDMFAEMLIPHNPSNKDQHFDSRARQLISAYLLHMASYDKYRDDLTLSKLRSLLRLPEADGEENRVSFLTEMQFNDSFDGIQQDNANEIKEMWLKGDREMQSIQSTALNATDIFKSQAMRRSLSTSDFDMADLTKGNMVIFLCIPAERLQTHNVWLRMLVSAVIKSVQRHPDKRVLLLLDEFYSLGYMKLIDQSLSFMPGFNLQIWTIVQNLSQLQENYNKNWETFISNSAVSTWLGVNDNTTSEYLSRLMGTRHVRYKPNQALLNEISGQNQSAQNYEMPVQSPLAIRENKGIYALVKGSKPLKFDKQPYYENEKLASRASRNPYFRTEA